jgi:hypothetical protein
MHPLADQAQELHQHFYGSLPGNPGSLPINAVNFNTVEGWEIPGQFLGFQSEGTEVGGDLGLVGFNPFTELHSMSLLVTLMYASDTQNVARQDWKNAA